MSKERKSLQPQSVEEAKKALNDFDSYAEAKARKSLRLRQIPADEFSDEEIRTGVSAPVIPERIAR